MVYVRSAHVDKPQNTSASDATQHWLSKLDDEARCQALRDCVQQLKPFCAKQPELLLKGQEMVEILIDLNLDQEALMAALITPALAAGVVKHEQVEKLISAAVLTLTQNVEQLQLISELQHFQHGKPSANQIDNVRKMLLAMVADVRAVLIKLAERICYLRQVKDADEEIKVLAAKECQDIYAPLANRLGVGQMKWELEDLAFRYLHPKTYKSIAGQLHERRIDRENYIQAFVAQLQQKLQEEGVQAQVYGRPKHIFSIWKKMQKKHLEFNDLYDIRAVRVITQNLKDCYAALGVVHSLWRHIRAEFDDYIATPKANGYQSIHTVVAGPEDKHVEIQIRTQAMHDDAELGVAAHWAYKEGATLGKAGGFEEKIAWLRKLLAWHEDMADNDELVAEIRSQVFEDRVYVFTPKGDVMDLPQGATPLDFAYYVHSQVGHKCVGAKVDGHIVPFTYLLKNGERIEVLTQKNAQPRRDWLNPALGYLNTSRARSKVQTYFKKLDREKHLKQGKEQLEAELQKLQSSLQQISQADAQRVLEKFNFTQLDDLYAAVGAGDVRLQQVVNQFIPPPEDKVKERLERLTKTKTTRKKGRETDVTVQGIGHLMTQFAKCCQPLPGEPIMGFVTQGRGVSVHRRDCEQLQHLLEEQPERGLAVSWSNAGQSQYRADVLVDADDRTGLLHDLTSVLANEKASVVQLDSKLDTASKQARVTIGVLVSDNEALQRIVGRLRRVEGVHQIQRLHA